MKIQNKQSGIIVLSTFPDEESAISVAEQLINKKLCACVSLTKVRSLYNWNNKLENHIEYIALFKTTSLTAEELKSNIKRAHPYEVPEIVELKMNKVSETYLSWMAEATKKKDKNKKKSGRSNKS
ncbi:MAG: divalent-cation tolerance protein CutA [Nitrososphaeraceae archaeon]